MSNPRWNSGLAQAVSNGAPGCSCISNDRADMIEELISLAEKVITESTYSEWEGIRVYDDAWSDFQAAVQRAKNWGRPEKCPACQGDGFITLPGEQPVCRKCRGLGEVKGK